MQQYIDRLHRTHLDIKDGEVATYIPELGKADPSWFAIALATVDGEVYVTGNWSQEFTIQSISKPFVYGMALEDCGVDLVLEHVGVEPTGDPFNSITLDEARNRPFNPMVNAGAIATTGLVRGATADVQWGRIMSGFAAFTGRPLVIDDAVFNSERSTGDRNRAIAYLMRNFGMIGGNVDHSLDLYFRQCSLLVSCRDLAIAAATLAAGGTNPVTGRRAMDQRHVANVLSVMQTCGMYDFAGSWTYDVGLPAKSGVSGGLVAVLPGQLGIAVFSPPLDTQGNSVRGVEVCRRIVRDFALHPYRAQPPSVEAVIARRYRGHTARSNRILSVEDSDAIDRHGDSLEVFEVQGHLYFADAERVVRTVLDVAPEVETVVLEGHRLAGVDPPAVLLFHGLARTLRDDGIELVFASFPPVDDSGRPLVFDGERFPDLDHALEWWEDRVLLTAFGNRPDHSLPLAAQELLRGLSSDAVDALEAAAAVHELDSGTVLAREGEPAESIFFILSGRVSVWLRLPDDPRGRRLASFGAGVAVGEMALLDAATRSADLVVDVPSQIAEVRVAALHALDAAFPDLRSTVYANLAHLLSARLRRANGRIRTLEQ